MIMIIIIIYYDYDYYFWDGAAQHMRFIWKRKVLSLLN